MDASNRSNVAGYRQSIQSSDPAPEDPSSLEQSTQSRAPAPGPHHLLSCTNRSNPAIRRLRSLQESFIYNFSPVPHHSILYPPTLHQSNQTRPPAPEAPYTFQLMQSSPPAPGSPPVLEYDPI